MSFQTSARASAALLVLAGCATAGQFSSDTDASPATSGTNAAASSDSSVGSGNASGSSAGSGTSGGAASGTGGPNAGQPHDAGGTPVDAGPPPPLGPVDGDPNKPMVSVPGVPCGVPNLLTIPTVKITNRDVALAYPCAHEGAQVTFFLFVHGTLTSNKIQFTMNAFANYQLVDSHNIIIMTPQAIGSQWGNGDNGQDLPHLYDVVDYAYTTFGSKFNIRSMWAQGGSWGSIYLASTLACDPKLKDHLKGIELVVGGGCPTCADRMSCIEAQQTLQLGNGTALTDAQAEMSSDNYGIAPYATMHHCGAKTGPTDVGADKFWDWPGCDPGWVYSYYLGPGNHADTWDAPSVLKMTEQMKATEVP